MAKASADFRKRYPNAVVVSRFCGATTESSALLQLLFSLCRQLRYAYFGKMSVFGVYEPEYEEEAYVFCL